MEEEEFKKFYERLGLLFEIDDDYYEYGILEEVEREQLVKELLEEVYINGARDVTKKESYLYKKEVKQ